jgi:hypothetical protein
MRQCQEGRAETDMGVRLQLDDFGKEALEAQTRDGSSRDAVIGTAARYYLADRYSGRVAWRAPRFLRRGDSEVGETDVEIDEDTMQALEQEARRQGIAPGRLVEHAFLYFVADVDSGRAMRRLANADED